MKVKEVSWSENTNNCQTITIFHLTKQKSFLDHSTSRHQKQKYIPILRTWGVICHRWRENVSRIQISYAQGVCIYPMIFIGVGYEVRWGIHGGSLKTSWFFCKDTQTIGILGQKYFRLFWFKLTIWIQHL